MASNPAPLRKSTHVFAVHQVPLECDVYDAHDYPSNTPVFLFFHSGGLVCGARIIIPPWLVQTCHQRKWPLVSASYRLLPQADGNALLEDVRAAYDFVQTLGCGERRRVIAGGASGGFFPATLIAHHLTPKPIALLSITGIPTFRHPFFNSSYLIPPDPIAETDIEQYTAEPVSIGRSIYDQSAAFHSESLLADGSKNPAFQRPTETPPGYDQDPNRGLLYDYFLYENMFMAFVEDVDPGFAWAADSANKAKLRAWPVTIFIQGSSDDDVSPAVCSDISRRLGPERGIYCEAEGLGHLFEKTNFLEDIEEAHVSGKPLGAVKHAIDTLDKVVAST